MALTLSQHDAEFPNMISNNPHIDELHQILTRMCALLMESSGRAGRVGAEVRRITGDLLDNLAILARDETLPVVLQNLFVAARDTGTTLFWMDRVVNQLLAENPQLDLGKVVRNACLFFALGTEARIIAKMEFTSREDVDALMARMKHSFDEAKEIAADEMDSIAYYSLVELAASLTHHLVKTAQPLPRLVEYMLPKPMPSLALSQRIYSSADRAEELVAANKVVHPAFVRPYVKALSS